jgi:hypothetical protein
LKIARNFPGSFAGWRPAIEAALFEHYEPYAEGTEQAGSEQALVPVDAPGDVWSHTTPQFVQVLVLDGRPAVEIGYEVAWDEEHTVAVRFQDGVLLELSGSVLPP